MALDLGRAGVENVLLHDASRDLQHYSSFDSLKPPSDPESDSDHLDINASGILENIGADGSIEHPSHTPADLEAQAPGPPPPSGNSSTLSLPGSRLLLAPVDFFTDGEILFFFCVLACVVVWGMFTWWEFHPVL
ncbi:hypothetical protein BKA63DRAFT_560313 [Paraphoma chrysanthemicola]|nr:hypothetical protein BKA63DRAFT_560313 [Paraphoma chrysanthemicola]